MEVSHLLDTSVFCQPIKPLPLPSVQRRWKALGDDALAISIICEAEVLYGLELRQSKRLTSLFKTILQGRLATLPVDQVVARFFAETKSDCRKKGWAASDFDLLIAATAKAHGLVLATLNVRHFNKISGLAVEDWST